MNDVRLLHREAMDLAGEAALEQSAGNVNRARDLYRDAFEKERQAAEALHNRFDLEPTRSVLFRSAAALALDSGDHRSAEKMIALALIGNPPIEIAEELRDLMENVYLQRHLEIRGVDLKPHEFQFSIAGKSIGHGLVESDVFVSRVQDVQKMFYRTAERKAQRPFRERGRPDRQFIKHFGTWLSVPRRASFAVTFRVGHMAQLTLPGLGPDPAESIITEVLDCLEVLCGDAPDEIEQRIPDLSYRRNFVALARRLAPDGKDVTTVGFTASVGATERRVALTRPGHEILPREPVGKNKTEALVTVQGTLKFANSLKSDRNAIKLVDEQGTVHEIIVPVGYMDDIVRPLWDSDVRVDGVRRGKKLLLRNVMPAEAPDDSRG